VASASWSGRAFVVASCLEHQPLYMWASAEIFSVRENNRSVEIFEVLLCEAR